MRNTLTIIALALALSISAKQQACYAQDYVPAPVSISKEKVKNNGKVYYSHIVLEKQTLYSISKAYNVTVEEIYEANPTQNLATEGLKKNAIILIPAKDGVTPSASTSAPQTQTSSPDDFFYHTAKWFEDLDAIAEKYGTTADVLMAFNGMKSKTISKKQKIKIPRNPQNLNIQTGIAPSQKAVEPEPDVEQTTVPAVQPQETKPETSLLNTIFGSTPKNEVSATLMLPFATSGRVSEDDMDFYAGVLLAAKDLGENGTGVDLSVFDVATSIPVTKERLEESDIIIGPTSTADINKALTILPEGKFIISPLDLRGETIANEKGQVIQKPTPLQGQYNDVISWIKKDMKANDKMIVITEKGAKSSAMTTAMTSVLQESGLTYASLSYGILEGRNIVNSLGNMMSTETTNRVIIISESEAFVNDAVRNLSLLTFRKYDIALYAPAKIRSFDTIDVEDFHKVNLHVSMTYYIDYNDSAVKDFLLKYRALYNTEPTPFAFQGYDTAKFFVEACAKHGNNWAAHMDGMTGSGLQANYRYVETPAGGYVNMGTRRIVYGPDFSISLEK